MSLPTGFADIRKSQETLAAHPYWAFQKQKEVLKASQVENGTADSNAAAMEGVSVNEKPVDCLGGDSSPDMMQKLELMWNGRTVDADTERMHEHYLVWWRSASVATVLIAYKVDTRYL